MTKKTQAAQPDPDGTRDVQSEYVVGYGKPPVATRFQPGRSGNPKGRAKHHRSLRTVVEDTLNQRIIIREGSRSRSVTKREALVLGLVNHAIQRDHKALNGVMMLLRATGLAEDITEPVRQGPLSRDDAAILDDYMRRHAMSDDTTSLPLDGNAITISKAGKK